MKKKSFILSLVFLLLLGGMSITVSAAETNEESNKDKIIKEANNVAEQFGLKPTNDNDFKGKRLEFDSVEEFEAFLEEEEKSQEIQKTQTPSLVRASTTTNSWCDKNLTGKICVQAKVDRTSSGHITGVSKVHSWQEGFIFGITWKEIDTGYSYSVRSGSAWAVGEKTYGISIEGIPAGYTQKYTIKVHF